MFEAFNLTFNMKTKIFQIPVSALVICKIELITHIKGRLVYPNPSLSTLDNTYIDGPCGSGTVAGAKIKKE